MNTIQLTLSFFQPQDVDAYRSEGKMPIIGEQPCNDHVFDLQREAVDLGPCQIDQFWLCRSTLYPTRNRHAPMYLPIVNAYWDLCREAKAHQEHDIKENYLLARLLPDIRDQGARDVFRDSVTHRRSARREKRRDANDLEDMLSQGIQSIPIEEFHRLTSEMLGPPNYSQEDVELYDEMAEHLLAPAREMLSESKTQAAVDDMRTRWQGWLSRIARRSGNDQQKRILNVLSYESKAAFHQAYSAVWSRMIPALWTRYKWSPQTARFHTFWQFVQRQPSTDYPGQYAYLFHGHILGLHTAAATFIQTDTGKRLIGEWLIDESRENFEMLVGGLAVAMLHYTGVYQQYQEDRSATTSNAATRWAWMWCTL